MDSDDLQRELDAAWAKATTGLPRIPATAAPPASFSLTDAPAITREASMEAMALMRRQHRTELARFQQYATFKEQSVRELADRLRAAESELDLLRQKEARRDESVYRELADASAKLESAQGGLVEQERRFAEEERLLRAVAERTREQLASETARWREVERQFGEREQDYLLRLRELEARAQQAQEDAAKHEGAHRRAQSGLQEAKGAIEGALAELLKERREREEADRERDRALARVKEVEEHVRELQNLWEEERKQWQELWDRERSAWETQRREFAEWEGRVRKEREDWHQQLRGLEGRENKYRDQMAEILHKSTDAGEKLSSFLRQAAEKAKAVAAGEAILPRKPRDWKKGLAAAAALALLAAAYPVWRHLHRLRFELRQSHVLLEDNPTGLAFDGNALWVSEWAGALSALDPGDPSQRLRREPVGKAEPYHPVSVAVWGDALFTLDSAQSRILRHAIGTPGRFDLAWPTPGPAPITLAHDGQNLWSYDAATRALYRHLGEGPEAQAEPYKVELDLLPTAMTWHNKELWVYDARGKAVLVFAIEGRSLRLLQKAPFPAPLQGMLLTPRTGADNRPELELWGLSVPGTGAEPPTVKKFLVKR